jgi:hypothetical protein
MARASRLPHPRGVCRSRHMSAHINQWLRSTHEGADYCYTFGCNSPFQSYSSHQSPSSLSPLTPKQVLDMFGAGVPVAAVAFPALPELISHGINGYVFKGNNQAKRDDLPSLHTTLRRLLVQSVSWRYGARTDLNTFAADGQEAVDVDLAANSAGSGSVRP